MESIITLFSNVEFWMGLSIVAATLPGPQTRILPVAFRAIAAFVEKFNRERK